MNRSHYRHILLALLALSALLVLAACTPATSEKIVEITRVVTETQEVPGEEVVVTRVQQPRAEEAQRSKSDRCACDGSEVRPYEKDGPPECRPDREQRHRNVAEQNSSALSSTACARRLRAQTQ